MKETGLKPDESEPIRYVIARYEKSYLDILVPMIAYRGSPDPFDCWRVDLESGKVHRLPRVRLANDAHPVDAPITRLVAFEGEGRRATDAPR